MEEAGLPGRDELSGDPGVVQGLREENRRRPLSDRPICAEHGDPRARQVARTVAELPKVAEGPGAADVDEGYAMPLRELDELGVVAQELVEASDDVEAGHDCLLDDRTERLGDVPAKRGDPDEQRYGQHDEGEDPEVGPVGTDEAEGDD